MRRDRLRGAGVAVLVALALAGCAAGDGPRPIALGTPCAACGMSIEDLRYACEQERDGAWRAYDAIECMARARDAAARAWLADYDSRTLVAADSAWVVRAEIPSPMGGGYAAFRDRGAAEAIAAERSGRVMRWSDVPATPAEGGR
jgi:nitrous oxide reductase accessory protein NosL